MFQFQCGAIGRVFTLFRTTLLPRFNSSVVRLGGNTLSAIKTDTKFQFQCGAIGSVWIEHSLVSFRSFNSSVVRLGVSNQLNTTFIREFQFQCGAIGRIYRHRLPLYSWQVSIPVWCDWECIAIDKGDYAAVFQFQCGAIGSKQPLGVNAARYGFNSSVVRLGVV